MSPRKTLCPSNTPQGYTPGEQPNSALSSNYLITILWILGGFLVSTFIISCAFKPPKPPKYDIYPTLSMADRRELPCVEDKEKGPFVHWKKHFCDEMDKMASNEWPPNLTFLNGSLNDAAKEYGVLPKDIPDPLLAQKAFFSKFKLETEPEKLKTDHKEADPKKNCAQCRIERMLNSIDYEHPSLLVELSYLKTGPTVNSYALPSLVSRNYPVDVSLTRWTAPVRPERIYTRTTTKEERKEGTKKDEGKGLAGQIEAKSCLIEDFKPEQVITLTLSTVLNSPTVLDRIEYVSTYIYLQPFPFPPNNDVILEKEFWKRFFALNSTRTSGVKKAVASTLSDMERTIEDMRVRIANTDTTVKLRDLDFGISTIKISEKFNAEIEATAIAPPFLTGVNPKLGYSRGVDTDVNTKLHQQLDQRSTYVDPSGHFLRITQRGMQSVNLAGRFLENVAILIPVAQERIPVLAPVLKTEKAVTYQVRWLSQPLYSRVDALTLSVVVARQATALAESSKDAFRLDDPKDAAFIAAVTRPYSITLWQHERELWDVMSQEIFGNAEGLTKKANRRVFFTTFEGERPAPLRLFDFTPEQRHTLFRNIREYPLSDLNHPISFKVKDDNKAIQEITIGLADCEENPTKLVGFR